MSDQSRQQVTINSRKYDGSIRRSWNCELIEIDDNKLVFVGIFDLDVSHSDLGHIKRGTISYEYYWLDHWYNVFCFYEPDGRFRNYYCNLNMPPVFTDSVLDYVDLDVDVLVWPDGNFEVLDQDEFNENAIKLGYPNHLREKVSEVLGELLEIIENGSLPPIRQILQQID